jgi:hypothetical protein
MVINKSIDIEDEIRKAIGDVVQTYVRPLPENFVTPSILIELIGGTSENLIDTFTVRLSSRAEEDSDALDLLRTALGVLEYKAKNQFGFLRFSTEQNLMNWGTDPVRPDLCLCQATVQVVAHKEQVEIEES